MRIGKLRRLSKVILAAASVTECTAQPTAPVCEDRKEFERVIGLDDSAKEKVELIFTVQYALAPLGYGTTFTGVLDAQTAGAIKVFRERHGLKASKVPLDCEVLQAALAAGDAYLKSQKSRMLSGDGIGITSSWDDGVASVKGTWTIAGGSMASPFQVSDFTCQKALGICIESTATLFQDSLMLETEFHELERWDEFEIVTKPQDTSCTRYVYRFNRAQKQLTGTRSTIKDGQLCEGVEKKEFHLILSDGKTVYITESEKASESMRLHLLVQGKAAELVQAWAGGSAESPPRK